MNRLNAQPGLEAGFRMNPSASPGAGNSSQHYTHLLPNVHD